MASIQYNGIDAAIALILALIESNAEASTADLSRSTGIPRSSLHRIALALSACGVVERSRGRLRAGPLGEVLVAANAERVGRADHARIQRTLRRLKRVPLSQWPMLPATEPLSLSKLAVIPRKGRYRIGFSNASMDNPWRVALVHSVEYAAANLSEHIEWLLVRHADDDPERQAADIEALAEAGTDGLIVSALASPLVHQAIRKAAARGIAIVLVDRGVPPGVAHTSFVTSDDAAIGRMTALWLAEILKGKGSVLILPGLSGAEPAQRRLAAAQAVFQGFPAIHPLAVEWTGWRADRAYDIVSDAISKWGAQINGVWCDSGLQGVGSLKAFADAGYGQGQVPPHTGGDLNLAYKLAIRLHVRLAAVDYPPTMGMMAVEVLFSALRGHWVPRFVSVPSEVILTKGSATRSVKPNLWAEDHVRWDLPDDLILATGLGPAYNPRSFRTHYPGNLYNRSAAQGNIS